MNEPVFEGVKKSSQILKLDFSSIEFAKLARNRILRKRRFRPLRWRLNICSGRRLKPQSILC